MGEFNPSDVDLVFGLLAGDDGKLTEEELVTGIARLRGTARTLDVNNFYQDLVKRIEQVKHDFNSRLNQANVESRNGGNPSLFSEAFPDSPRFPPQLHGGSVTAPDTPRSLPPPLVNLKRRRNGLSRPRSTR